MGFFEHQASKFPLASVLDYRLLAKKRIPEQIFDYIDGGAFHELTMKRNVDDYCAIQLRKRALKDVSDVRTDAEVLGQKMSAPLILAPVGFAGVYARRGEAQAARAAGKAGLPFCLSNASICPIEEVSRSAPTPFWFQLYISKDRDQSAELLKRAEAAGCPVLLLTVDLPTASAHYRYRRSCSSSNLSSLMKTLKGFYETLSHLRWFTDVRLRGRPLTLGNLPSSAPSLDGLPNMRKWMGSQLDWSFTWKDVEWVRTHWPGKIVLKGVLDPEDASMAADVGADGIVVSNHGARHLDCTPSTISVLPSIVEAAGNRLEILVDGGITNGLDVVKALALGARACMIGRAWAFGLAARKEQGVSEVLAILRNELEIVMRHLGVSRIREIDRSVIT